MGLVFRWRLKTRLELRLKIYGYLLCFNKMKMKALYKQEDVIKLGIFWLQHNPLTNRLALLSVNRLVYYEARQFFYSRNTFSFGRTEDIPVFLFGIGEQNSSFLQSVMWPNGGGQRVNKIDFLRALMGTGNGKGPQQGRGITIWNNTEKYLEFLRVLNIITARNLRGFHRLLRPTHSVRDQLSIGNGDAPTRFVFNVTCQFAGGVEKEMTAGYTLFNRWSWSVWPRSTCCPPVYCKKTRTRRERENGERRESVLRIDRQYWLKWRSIWLLKSV